MKLVCFGDSLTHGYKIKLSEAWPSLISKKYNVEVLNKGIIGDTTGGMLARLNIDVLMEKPSHAVIMGGCNDLLWGVPLSVIEANIAAMVHQSYHNCIIPIIGIPIPCAVDMAKRYWPFVNNFDLVNKYLIAYRDWIFDFANDFHVDILDFYNCFIDDQNTIKDVNYVDGIHPTVKGNLMMSELAKYLFKDVSNFDCLGAG